MICLSHPWGHHHRVDSQLIRTPPPLLLSLPQFAARRRFQSRIHIASNPSFPVLDQKKKEVKLNKKTEGLTFVTEETTRQFFSSKMACCTNGLLLITRYRSTASVILKSNVIPKCGRKDRGEEEGGAWTGYGMKCD